MVYDREEEGLRMPLISIATLIVAIGFAFVCIYIAILILQVAGLLTTVGQTIDEVERQLDQTIIETEQLIGAAESTAIDVEEKLQATSGVFDSLESAGEASAIMSQAVKEKAKHFTKEENLIGTTPFIRAIQWGEYSSVLFESWARGKRAAFGTKPNQ